MLKYSRQEGVRSAYRPLTTKISFRFVNFSYFRTKSLSRVVKVPVYTKDWALVGKCNCFALVTAVNQSDSSIEQTLTNQNPESRVKTNMLQAGSTSIIYTR